MCWKILYVYENVWLLHIDFLLCTRHSLDRLQQGLRSSSWLQGFHGQAEKPDKKMNIYNIDDMSNGNMYKGQRDSIRLAKEVSSGSLMSYGKNVKETSGMW